MDAVLQSIFRRHFKESGLEDKSRTSTFRSVVLARLHICMEHLGSSMPTVPIIGKPVFEIGNFIKQTCQTLATDDASAVDSDIDDCIGKSAIDDNDDSFD
ncbi:hypothetical protein Forpi1262_v017206 [Fusarium oxysporum f. sp. raphani]|uniref:Uncharacterized protein n=1 Tax=Fusarium oxysporum f. sp. raphani TaxID=96318 RepID=A0A8J5U8R6_FUSOX|nr:hypothetical protein Forpi1262_v017206 [Fusarium oxysporum f. sp. raphani]